MTSGLFFVTGERNPRIGRKKKNCLIRSKPRWWAFFIWKIEKSAVIFVAQKSCIPIEKFGGGHAYVKIYITYRQRDQEGLESDSKLNRQPDPTIGFFCVQLARIPPDVPASAG